MGDLQLQLPPAGLVELRLEQESFHEPALGLVLAKRSPSPARINPIPDVNRFRSDSGRRSLANRGEPSTSLVLLPTWHVGNDINAVRSVADPGRLGAELVAGPGAPAQMAFVDLFGIPPVGPTSVPGRVDALGRDAALRLLSVIEARRGRAVAVGVLHVDRIAVEDEPPESLLQVGRESELFCHGFCPSRVGRDPAGRPRSWRAKPVGPVAVPIDLSTSKLARDHPSLPQEGGRKRFAGTGSVGRTVDAAG